jgi:hypothetical protein
LAWNLAPVFVLEFMIAYFLQWILSQTVQLEEQQQAFSNCCCSSFVFTLPAYPLRLHKGFFC